MQRFFAADIGWGVLGLCLAGGVQAQANLARGGNPLDSLPRPAANSGAAQAPTPLLLPAPPTQAADLLQRPVRINRIDIVGVNAVPFDSIANLFQPLSGNTTTIAQLAATAEQATAVYKQAGYALSFVYVPPQLFEQGIARIVAVEGYVGNLQIVGDSGKSEELLREMAAPLLQERPLKLATFQRQTQLMARMQSLQIVASAELPTSTDGATMLTLQTKRQPISVAMGGELRQGDSKAVATVTLNDPLWRGSQWQFSGLLRRPSEERFLSASLTQWLNASGTALKASYSDYRGRDELEQVSLNALTHQRRAELMLSHPLKVSANENITVSGGLYAVDLDKIYNLQTLELLDRERVRALQAQWNWQQSSATVGRSASLSLAKGLGSLGAGWTRAINADVALADNPANFEFLRLGFDYQQRHRFANQFGAAFGLGGQYSRDDLPISERVSFGGTRFGRGYRSGEASGDTGIGVSAEISRIFSTPSNRWIKTLEPYVMYEYARTRFRSVNLQGQTLKSSSLGIRLADQRYYVLDVAVSKPQGDASISNPDNNLRYSLSLSYQLGL